MLQQWVIDPSEEEECAGDARLIMGLRLPKFAQGESVQMTEAEQAAGKWRTAPPDIPAGEEFPDTWMPNMSVAVPCYVDFDGPVEYDIAQPASPAGSRPQKPRGEADEGGRSGSAAVDAGKRAKRFWTGGGKVEGAQVAGGGVEQFEEDFARSFGPVDCL